VSALDTSVVIAAFVPWHEAHTAAVRAVTPEAVVPAHVVTETYAVLTRMPEPFRMDAATMAAYLARQWGGRVIAPDAQVYESLTAAAAAAGVLGGHL
jgi:predicted nucleic acid-binding protein